MSRRIAQARHLRKAATPAERLLWSRLRNQQLCGFKFRRQHPIGGRIVDFYCVKARVAVELDGSGHGYDAGRSRDAIRTAQLQESGLRIIRFWNEEVLRDADWVLDAILLELDRAKSRWATPAGPSPQSSP